MNKHATIIDEDAEHYRAQWWRRRLMLLKHDQLSDLIGWSERQIYQLETGLNGEGRPFSEAVWRRYRMACAGIHAQKYGWQKGREFEWRM